MSNAPCYRMTTGPEEALFPGLSRNAEDGAPPRPSAALAPLNKRSFPLFVLSVRGLPGAPSLSMLRTPSPRGTGVCSPARRKTVVKVVLRLLKAVLMPLRVMMVEAAGLQPNESLVERSKSRPATELCLSHPFSIGPVTSSYLFPLASYVFLRSRPLPGQRAESYHNSDSTMALPVCSAWCVTG